jgi:hypothetical protein
MSDFDDETLERELFARREDCALGAPRTRAGTARGLEDVFTRIDGERRRSRRTRVFGVARVVSQAGTAFAAAAACLALVRGLPTPAADEVRPDETGHMTTRAFTQAFTRSAGTMSAEAPDDGTNGLACSAESDRLGIESACEAPAEAVSMKAETVSSLMRTTTLTTPPAPLACESVSCGGEVTCAGDGP